MVTAPAKTGLPLMLIDVLGALAFLGCLLGGGYLAVVRGGEVGGEIRDLTAAIRRADDDLSAARAACDRQRTILHERQTEAATERQLPAKIPLERYFQRISALAEASKVHVLRQNPLPGRQYPGLLEQRFAFEVTGAMSDLARFLYAVEQDESWADVAYFKITRPEGQAAENDRLATMTLSLFSSDHDAQANEETRVTP